MPRRGFGLSTTPTETAAQVRRDYYLALGRFVSQFAHTEGLMQLTLRHFAGLGDDIGSALLSGVRADQARDLINRVLDARRRPATKMELKRHFDHFGLITKIRNDILHYGVEFETTEILLISNDRDAHIPEKLR